MTPYYQEDGITLYHGDCREILPTFPDKSFDLVLTDPPYGMNYDTNGNRFTFGGRSFPPVVGDDGPFDVSPWVDFPFVVLWGFNHFPTSLPPGGCLVWLKRSDAAFGKFLSDAEVAWVKGIAGVYAFRETTFTIAAARQHPTQKPQNLMVWSISKSGAPEAASILDPFCGSGTTLVAAKQLGRKAVGIEIEEKYCEIAVKRLAQMELFA